MLKLKESQRLLVLSLLVGLCTGFAAVVLQALISLVQAAVSPFTQANHLWRIVLPGIGMLISGILVRYVIKDNIGHGVTKVLLAVSTNDSRIKPHNMWSSVLTSALTIGFGGSVGAEAPIVYTGAAIGSNIGKAGKLSYRNMTILVGCGAAGAIAGVFKAPLAGLLFTMEILLFNVSLASMMPLLVSTVSATVVAYLFRGVGPSFECTLAPFAMRNIPFYIVLGVACGLMSLYFTRTTLKLEDRFARIRKPWVRWAIAAVGVGLMVYLFPPLYGEGYGDVGILLNGAIGEMGDSPLAFLTGSPWGLVAAFVVIMFVKVVSMTLTNAGGGVGGTFGPTLFVGAIVGFVVSRLLNVATGDALWDIPEPNFVLVGMAAMMAGVMQAPMTSIFLIAEITGGYDLLVPLITASAVSFGVTRIWERYSIYTKRIAQSGELLTHDSDQAVLTLLKTSDLVRDKYPRIELDATLGEIMETVSNSTAAIFPVVSKDGIFQGVVDMDDIRKHMFDSAKYDSLRVYNLMKQPPAYVERDEKMSSVLEKFEKTEAWRLPVIDEQKHYLGFISKSRILMAYREELKRISAED
ncbi:MAG: chloride channel protein [Bacteroidales bacterium]|nr:chloride channel protein [Bacteroidales bacterium]